MKIAFFGLFIFRVIFLKFVVNGNRSFFFLFLFFNYFILIKKNTIIIIIFFFNLFIFLNSLSVTRPTHTRPHGSGLGTRSISIEVTFELTHYQHCKSYPW